MNTFFHFFITLFLFRILSFFMPKLFPTAYLLTVFSVIPDLDNFYRITKVKYSKYHRKTLHNVYFSMIIPLFFSFMFKEQQIFFLIGFFTYFFHLLCDLIYGETKVFFFWPLKKKSYIWKNKDYKIDKKLTWILAVIDFVLFGMI